MLKVYHFDINGTIIGIDSTDNASIDEMASEAFARSINVDGEIYSEGEMTYYSHIKDTHQNYKQKVYNFINDFPTHKNIYEELVNKFKQGLFESFLKLVEKEFATNESLLILRTFGKDRNIVADMLNNYGVKFIFSNVEQLNDKLYQECHDKHIHIMVQDNYQLWNKNKKSIEFGKPVKHFEGITQYAFDDNLCMNCDKEVQFNHVNTVQAALDHNYYLRLNV